MFEAIVTGLIAAVAVVIIVAVGIALWNNRKTPKAGQVKAVKQLDTVGVGTSPFERHSAALSNKSGEVRVTHSGHGSVRKPADSLRSRFVALGVLAGAIFGSLTVKLYSLQVFSASDYASDAEDNLYSNVRTPAPRGYICDSQGVPIVKNRTSQTVLADPDVVDDRDVMRRLSVVLGIPASIVRQRIQDSSAGAQSKRVVASDVRLRDVAFIAEHADAFPGVSVESRAVRDYPYGALAAHLLGYTGLPSKEQLDVEVEGREILSTDYVGKSGVESTYDNLLAGDHGHRRVTVDVLGNVLDVVSETQPVKGSDVYLTVDSRVQYVADKTLAELIAPEGVLGEGTGVGGAVFVMDVTDGSVIALSSYPTFEPEQFTGSIPTDVWNLYTDELAHAPLNNRVINGLFAAASTYKSFTSIAALDYGFADFESEWNCKGYWDGFKTGSVQKCWDHSGHGKLDLHEGIVNSCDVVFYEIAKAFFDHGPDGTGEVGATAIQDVLAKYRLDQTTGIDLAGESRGRIPTPEWKANHWRDYPAEAVWRGGDYTNMIIGQGDVLVTPIEIAVAYGAIATGRIMKPHLLKEVRNAAGDVVVTYEPEVVAEPDVNPDYLSFVRSALRGVITDNASTAKNFEKYGLEAAGKSGTAEHVDKGDDAWFVAYAPYNDPKYVVSVVIEQGGGGSAIAGPIAAKVLGAAMDVYAEKSEVSPTRLAGYSGKAVEYKTQSAERTD